MKLTRCLSLICALSISVSANIMFLPNLIFEDQITANAIGEGGSCGTNVSWSYDGAGVLTISGEGAMTDFEGDAISPPPWKKGISIDLEITQIIIEEGVTEIGNYSFVNCASVKSVSIPTTVTRIGERAFDNCGMSEINLPNSLKLIGGGAFLGCRNLLQISIPESVESIGTHAFFCCTKLSKVFVFNSNCQIYDNHSTFLNLDSHPNPILYGYKNSQLETYAKKYDYSFMQIEDNLINDMKNTSMKANSNSNYQTYTAGQEITMGLYEQDGDTSNGQEEIQWIVLDIDEDKALLLSKYGLDCRSYHNSNASVSWIDSDICHWLNHDFYDAAFSLEQKAQIIPNSNNPVWLLSSDQSNEYYETIPYCTATQYAQNNGAEKHERNGLSWWWLRTDETTNRAARMTEGATFSLPYVDSEGITPSYGGGTVRPAIWLSVTQGNNSEEKTQETTIVTSTENITTTTKIQTTLPKPECHPAMSDSDYMHYCIPIMSDKMPEMRFLSGYSTSKQLADGVVYISIEDACRLVGADIVDIKRDDCVVVNRNTVTWSCSVSNKPNQYLLIEDNAGEGDYYKSVAANTVEEKIGWKAWTFHPYEDFAVTWDITHEETAVPVVCEAGSLFVSIYDFAYVFGAKMRTVSSNIPETVQNATHILESCRFTMDADRKHSIEQYISEIYAPYQDYDFFVECVAGLPADELYQKYYDYGNGLQCDFAEYYSNVDLGTANIIRATKDFGIYDSIKSLWNLDTQFDEQLTNILLHQPDEKDDQKTSLIDMTVLSTDTLGLYGDIKELNDDSTGIVGLINKSIVEAPSPIGKIDFSAFDFVSPIPESIQTYLDYVSTYEQLSNATEDCSSLISVSLINNPIMKGEIHDEIKESPKYLLPVVGGMLRGADTVLREKNSAINLYHSAQEVQQVINSSKWEAYINGVKQSYLEYKTNLIDTIAVKSIDAYLFGGIPFSETLYDCLQSAQHSDLFESDPFLSDRVNISHMDDYIFIQDIVADGFNYYGRRSDERYLCYVFDIKASMLAFEALSKNNPAIASDKLKALKKLYNESYRIDINKSYYNTLFNTLSSNDRPDFETVLSESDNAE